MAMKLIRFAMVVVILFSFYSYAYAKTDRVNWKLTFSLSWEGDENLDLAVLDPFKSKIYMSLSPELPNNAYFYHSLQKVSFSWFNPPYKDPFTAYIVVVMVFGNDLHEPEENWMANLEIRINEVLIEKMNFTVWSGLGGSWSYSFILRSPEHYGFNLVPESQYGDAQQDRMFPRA